MSNARFDALTWALIYGGLLVVSFSLFVLPGSASFGWTLLLVGAAATAAGIALVWVRSRRSP